MTKIRTGSNRKQIRWAAGLTLTQGVLMEALPFVALPVLLLADIGPSTLAHGFSFIVPYFNENLYLMMAMSGIFGAMRIIGAIGLLKDRMWGYWFSIANCLVTLVLMIFMLPAGIADGLLSGTALLLLLMARFGQAPIELPTRTEPPPDAEPPAPDGVRSSTGVERGTSPGGVALSMTAKFPREQVRPGSINGRKAGRCSAR